MLLVKGAGIIITMLGGKMYFLTKDEYEEDEEGFTAETKNVIYVRIEDKGVGMKKLSELPPMSLTIMFLKSTMETVETIDSENVLYKSLVQAKSGLII